MAAIDHIVDIVRARCADKASAYERLDCFPADFDIPARSLGRIADPMGWLDDIAINSMSRLVREHVLTYPPPDDYRAFIFPTYFFDKYQQAPADVSRWMKKRDLFAHTVGIVPINENRDHWKVLLINIAGERFEMFNSMGCQLTASRLKMGREDCLRCAGRVRSQSSPEDAGFAPTYTPRAVPHAHAPTRTHTHTRTPAQTRGQTDGCTRAHRNARVCTRMRTLEHTHHTKGVHCKRPHATCRARAQAVPTRRAPTSAPECAGAGLWFVAVHVLGRRQNTAPIQRS